ncbi:MAG: DHH family phosphoesterase [Halolamina sp.]
MTSRLVLGCGGVGRDVVADLTSWAGATTVLVADERRAASLREAGLPAEHADPTEPAAFPEAVDTVFVAGDTPARNLTAARRARERFPEAMLVAYAGADPAESVVAELRAVADRVVDPVSTLSEAAVAAAEDRTGRRLRGLRRLLGSLEGPLAVVAHDNPDPDAIAAAVGVADIAESTGVSATPCYYGDISHHENRALVNLLDISLTQLSAEDLADDGLVDYDSVALVDHSRPGVNDSLPETTPVDVVVDHHPPRGPVNATFVDLAPHVGAASTLVAEYYRRFGLDPSRRIASALLYGLRVDTDDFTREVDERDYEAAAFLLDHADTDVLDRVEQPSVGAETFEALARAIRGRDRRGSAVVSFVGDLSDRDALAQAAERLLTIDGVRTTVVAGVVGDTVYVSARARGADVDLGEALREAFGPIGSAGGHANMAGAQLPLGILSEVDTESRETLGAVVEPVVAERVFETLSDAPTVPSTAGAVTEYADRGGAGGTVVDGGTDGVDSDSEAETEAGTDADADATANADGDGGRGDRDEDEDDAGAGPESENENGADDGAALAPSNDA